MKAKYQFDLLRIIKFEGSEIYYAILNNLPIFVENKKDSFDDHYKELLTPNLDLLYLDSIDKLKVKNLNDEQYSDDIIDVSFKYSLKTNKKGEFVYKRLKTGQVKEVLEIRKYLYENGFTVNGEKYVRYKRSSGSARNGSCLFIKESLFKKMDKWSNTNLNPKDYEDNLVSFEAYKALSLSGLIGTIKLNPNNFLFVKDKEIFLPKEKVERVYLDSDKLKVSEEECEIKNNIWDGEGLLDKSVFDESKDYINKGMMLLRNRFFKCCVFNTNLQEWFKENNITDVNQLNGFTFATDIRDIKVVVTESSLKYFKMLDGYKKENIRKWCDAICDENGESLFGIVKTDKPTRFFYGDMVETTYQFLNTIQLSEEDVAYSLMKNNIEYAEKIRDIKNKPEYARLFIEGEQDVNGSYRLEEVINYDDSEDIEEKKIEDTNYSYKKKICKMLLDINRDITQTAMFRYYIYDEVIASMALRLYDGRALVDGTNATLFGNPYELLLNIVNKFDDKSHFLKKDEICSLFFEEGENLVCSRAPHVTFGNVLCATNRRNPEIEKWFNLTREIVIVDAINNNIQYRLNGADYDSDSMLITNNRLLYERAYMNYDKFLVPYSDFGPNKQKRILPLAEMDHALADNKVGQIINYSQLLNSYYWDKLNNNEPVEGIYQQIAKLAALSGAAIDSAKRSFPFSITGELNESGRYLAKLNLVSFTKKEPRVPLFFYKLSHKKSRKIGQIENYIRDHQDEMFKTTLDFMWVATKNAEISETRIKNPKTFAMLTKKGYEDSKRGGKQYGFRNNIIKALKDLYNDLSFKKPNAEGDEYEEEVDIELDKRTFKQKVNKYVHKLKNNLSDEQIVRMAIIKLDKEQQKDDSKLRGTYSNLFLLLFYLIYKVMGYEDACTFLRQVLITNKPVRKLKRTQTYFPNKDFTLFDKYSYNPYF